MTFIKIQEPQPSMTHVDRKVFALWRLGFRPFYGLAALFACLSILVWGAQWFGLVQWSSHIDIFWHAHEMVFGFLVAVVIGFLYTAARNWTGLDTPVQGKLMLIAGLWCIGRVAMLVLPPWPAMAVDISFLPVAIWPLAQVLIRAKSKRNYSLLGILLGLFLLNLGYHLARLQVFEVSPLIFVHAAILLVVMIASIIAGRIIPSFTGNALPTSKPIVKAWQEKWGLYCFALSGAAWLLGAHMWLVLPLSVASFIIQSLRCWGWRPWATRKNALLWILHVSFLWVPVGCLLIAAQVLGWVSKSVVIHTFAVGGLAGLIIAMITRTALGHTGRPLKAERFERIMYIGVVLAATARVLAGFLPESYAFLVQFSILTWVLAFGLYLWRYIPYLMRPRVDGKQG